MPELPEVETTRRGVEPHCTGRAVTRVIVRQAQLRWPVSPELCRELPGLVIRRVERRAKYLIFRTDSGAVLVHLGMSGSLRLVPAGEPPRPHDHIDILFDTGVCLRYHDPRRFGSFFWLHADSGHPLLDHLGPEPLSENFTGELLYQRSRGRSVAVKALIMDGKVVVGVGNIYANEALFLAGIRPDRAAGRISKERYQRLADKIKQVLTTAIEQGGTTLRDFVGSDGRPGYFAQQLLVYGREGQPCSVCGTVLRERRVGQRSTVYCVTCQH